MTDLAFRSATELAAAISAGEISSLELTDLFIDRIERYDADINAVVVRDFDRAREAAREADAQRASGAATGPLHGVPMTIKEAYDVEGLATTWGFEMFAENIAATDAEVVSRFKRAGAVFVGKTNVPVALADFQSYNSIYGTTGNPWDVGRTPGGSSGGSSAALAAGFCALESGSDIGGSIRNPAHFCGVYGHKPTWPIVPAQGHALPGSIAGPDIAVVGPMARSAEDLRLALDVVAGPEPLRQPGWTLSLPEPRHRRLSDFRVAIWPTDDLAPVDIEVEQRAREIGDVLRRAGATVSDTARPAFDPQSSHITYLELLNSIMGAGIDPETKAQFAEMVANAGPDTDPVELASARGMVLSHADWILTANRREELRYMWREFFDDWDVLICPQTATPAFPHDQSAIRTRTLEVNGEEQPYFAQLFWAGLITVAYLPSTVFPTGLSSTGLPIGLQAVSGEYHDHTTIEFARLMADEIGGFVAPPGLAG